MRTAPRWVPGVRNGAPSVSTPLYRLKAEFFKTLGHPVRIRVLELLSEREHAVSEMLGAVGVEAAHLSQQLAVLRRARLVTARRGRVSPCTTRWRTPRWRSC
ncbi:Transcriptional regulator OS=Streptomyces microflavus OX=1919 GN=Smic_17230 PE=4 SV=1 [Streptomyces microflavus]